MYQNGQIQKWSNINKIQNTMLSLKLIRMIIDDQSDVKNFSSQLIGSEIG